VNNSCRIIHDTLLRPPLRIVERGVTKGRVGGSTVHRKEKGELQLGSVHASKSCTLHKVKKKGTGR